VRGLRISSARRRGSRIASFGHVGDEALRLRLRPLDPRVVPSIQRRAYAQAMLAWGQGVKGGPASSSEAVGRAEDHRIADVPGAPAPHTAVAIFGCARRTVGRRATVDCPCRASRNIRLRSKLWAWARRSKPDTHRATRKSIPQAGLAQQPPALHFARAEVGATARGRA